jgi:hypothetical protein
MYSGYLGGLAESVDRNNSDRTDKAVVLTESLARFYLAIMDDDLQDRITEAITLVANFGAHELGHILGLEHATEVDTSEPRNIMNYNDAYTNLGEQEFCRRTNYIDFAEDNYSFVYHQIGFQNEIDLLLRNIGSGTVMGT